MLVVVLGVVACLVWWRNNILIRRVMSTTAPRSARRRSSTKTFSTSGCCHRRCLRNRDEQECREVYSSTPHRFLRLPVRQTRMLQFYYDFVDRYVERPLFQYCEMDTDSAYIALAGESIDGLVKADRRCTTSDTDPNGFRSNVATNTKTTMSVLE